MEKNLKISGITVIILIGIFSGCTNKPQITDRDKFVGIWTCKEGISKDSSFTCFSDGTGVLSNVSITWILKDGKFVISYKGIAIPYNYSFSNNDKQLTLNIEGSSISEVYIKTIKI